MPQIARAVSPRPVAPPPVETWTTDLVRDALIDALRWARYSAGRPGPAGMVSARLPVSRATLEEHLACGWGIPETAEVDEQDQRREEWRLHFARSSPRQVQRHIDALTWVAHHVARTQPVRARLLQLWLASRVRSAPFDAACKKEGLSRPAAYRARDAALSMISVALDRAGVPVKV